MIELRRFFLFFIILLLAIAAQVRVVELAGWAPDLILTTLIVFAFWSTIAEQSLFSALTALFINWRPGFVPELVFLALFPIGIFFIRTVFPWRRGITLIIAIALGIIGLYWTAGATTLFDETSIIGKDIAVCIVYGVALFWSLRSLYHPKARGFGSIYALPR